MVNDNFQPSIPTGSSKGVIFQRRSSVIREVPRVDTTAAKKEGEDENDDESQTSQESGGPSTRTWRTRRKIRRDSRVDKKCANDDEWRPLGMIHDTTNHPSQPLCYLCDLILPSMVEPKYELINIPFSRLAEWISKWGG